MSILIRKKKPKHSSCNSRLLFNKIPAQKSSLFTTQYYIELILSFVFYSCFSIEIKTFTLFMIEICFFFIILLQLL